LLKQANTKHNGLERLNASATVAVASMPALPPGEEIFDLMPPQGMAYPWLQLLWQAAGVVLAFWLLWLFYRWLTEPVPRTVRVLNQNPQKLALRAIERLKLSPVWQQRQLKEICETLAGVLKTYARQAYKIGLGASSTSDELLDSFDRQPVSDEVVSRVRQFLDTCDRVKFTGVAVVGVVPEDLADQLSGLVMHQGWLK